MEEPPAILDGKFYKIVYTKGDEVQAKCLNCPGEKLLKGAFSGLSNFTTHYKRKHHDLLDDLDKHKESKRKERLNRNNMQNQMSIDEFTEKKSPNDKFNDMIFEYICRTGLPLSHVEDKEFRTLITGLSSDKKLMSRRTFTRYVEAKHETMMKKIKERIANVQYICVTADIWSCGGKSFFGMTAHWVLENLQQESVALACSRFKGSHTWDRIGSIFLETLKRYDIKLEKVVAAITDNASNFVKAFAEFEVGQEVDGEVDTIEDELKFHEIGGLYSDSLELEDDVYRLPYHIRCASHTLSLLATTDLKNIISDISCSKVAARCISKCHKLWALISRSSNAYEVVEGLCSRKLRTPAVTRWNSLYDSLRVILELKEELASVFSSLGLSALTANDYDFIEEYVDCVSPIAIGIDRLQGQNGCYLANLIPTLHNIESRLRRGKPLKYLAGVGNILAERLRERFTRYFTSLKDAKEEVLAAMSHPYFKLDWVSEADKQHLQDIFILEAENLHAPIKTTTITASDTFFDFLKTNNSQSSQNTVRLECMQYFAEQRRNIELLHSYKSVKAIFIKYNCCIPSSAPVERLFSLANLVLEPRRRALNDDHFETLLLLKANN